MGGLGDRHSTGTSSVPYRHNFSSCFCILLFGATDQYFYCLCQIVASTINNFHIKRYV